VVHSRIGFVAGLVFLAGAVGAAQGQQGGLENRVTVLEKRMATVEGQVAAQGRQLEAVLSQLVELNDRTTALEQGSAALGSQLSLLGNRTTALEQLTGPTYFVNVNCAAGQTIGDALARTSSHLGVVTIRVSGTCTENVMVTRSQTVIVGVGTDAEIVAPTPAGDVVTVEGVRGSAGRALGLRNLTVRGGSSGIAADFGALVQIDNVTIRESGTGVSVSNRGMVSIRTSRIESNFFGVVGREGAHIVVNDTYIRDNTDYGLNLENGSTAYVRGSFITGNQGGNPGTIRGAVGLYQGSTLRIGATEVTRNKGNAFFGAMGSVLWLEEGVKIDSNGGHGISMLDAGVVGKYYVVTDISITNNGGYGISCSPSPGVAQLYGFPPAGQPLPNVTGNRLGDYGCPSSPNPPWQW